MELKLKKAQYNFYEPLALTPFSCETLRESIVPDSQGDIARIVETTALVSLTGRELMGDGRFSASGTVDVSVLYMPEKGQGPCALKFQIPFQSYGEGAPECAFPGLRGEVANIDTRLLNPRKVLTRVNLTLYPMGCRKVGLELCTDSEEEGDSLQLLKESRETRVIAGVREKEFRFVEELPLSQGREGGEEILSYRGDVQGTDCKLIGNKLVVKGVIAATVLYREQGGRVGVLAQELPFSQILDGAGFDEESECGCAYQLLGGECHLGSEDTPDDPYTVTLSLNLMARATVWKTETVRYIADLYSTDAPVRCDTGELTLREDSQSHVRRVNARELLETGEAARAVVDAQVCCAGVQVRGEEMQLQLQARCLYLDEKDALRGVSKEFSVTCPTEQPEGTELSVRAQCRGDIMSSILPDGIELRFPVECTVESCRPCRRVCVCGGETVEEEASGGPTPSLVLRKLGREETLWMAAKQYRTTCQAILAVNGITDGAHLPVDRLLLIPKAVKNLTPGGRYDKH